MRSGEKNNFDADWKWHAEQFGLNPFDTNKHINAPHYNKPHDNFQSLGNDYHKNDHRRGE
jgi:hypothetical protein